MQYSNNGINYRVVDGGTKIISNLPPKVYTINFDQMIGTWLSERKELVAGDFKIYGNTPRRVDKIFKTFDSRSKNLGILLSGDKGMGKSVFMRYTAEKAIERGLPVIVISNDIPGLANFLGKIDQECVVLFDEFEKNFLKDGIHDGDEQGGQTQFLSLFDGTDSGKKLFMVAINSCRKLSEFFINRPGRFYYHFKFNYLAEDEVREYAIDNLKNGGDDIEKLVLIAKFHDINYDILAAIVNELNNGYSLKESVNDLNIDISEERKCYDIKTVIDGIELTAKAQWICVDADDDVEYLTCEGSNHPNIEVCFDMTQGRIDRGTGNLVIGEDGIRWTSLERPFGRYTREGVRSEDESCKPKVTKLVLTPHTWSGSGLYGNLFY